MGTRGWYIYKWQGRYYVYYNYMDSYPSGLGKGLVNRIPSDPEEYQEWLQRKRSDYSKLAERCRELFIVSMDKVEKDPDPKEGLVDGIDQIPGYLPPEGDGVFIQWIYTIDLDKEIFVIHGSSFFHLAKIPSHFLDLMEEAQEYWLGNVCQNKVHESITTPDIHPTPLTSNPTPAFLQMKPTTIYPKQRSRLNDMPAFVACKSLYGLLLRSYKHTIPFARDCHFESDILYRELVFALLCLASCSPALVRLIATENMKYHGATSNDWSYGVILDHGATREPKEFVTRFLRGYHLEGMEAGSAPQSTSYWFSGALVYLRRDITSRERFHDAIVSAVAKGKADGRTHFSAIIISLKHFILLKFVDGNVQHTKRLNFDTCPKWVKPKLIHFYHDDKKEESHEEKETEEMEGSEEKKNTEEKGGSGQNSSGPETTTDNDGETTPDSSDDNDWVDDANVPAFEILANFFEVTQTQHLKPTTIYNDGVFPNEVYQRILRYVDRETNIAWRQVSRVFRDFASETFIMDNGLKLVHCPGKEPECFHDTVGFVGHFEPALYEYGRIRSRELRSSLYGCAQWIPVFGTPDGSASMEASIALAFPSLRAPETEESDESE
ncbi:hypothetical protein F4859DRAFT_179230 [Xylaria cf. heliscus]|nr:hypothetical protein F4859DRAFT_179230 [Xylaria cf. heliscus]